LTKRLSELGAEVPLIEGGSSVPRESDNSSVSEVFKKRTLQPSRGLARSERQEFRPSTWYNIGGSTKFFGTVMTPP
jgi:hypothetical protein